MKQPATKWSIPAHGRVLAQPDDALTTTELLAILPRVRAAGELSDARRNEQPRTRTHALTSAERTRMAQSAEVREQLRLSGQGAYKTFITDVLPTPAPPSAAAKHAAKKRARAAAIQLAPNAALVALRQRQTERAAMTAGTAAYRRTGR